MIDLESMIKSLRVAWLKRIFGENDGARKSYLQVSLKRHGGLFLFYCNNITISKTILFLPFFIPSYFGGGQNSKTVMILKMNGNI